MLRLILILSGLPSFGALFWIMAEMDTIGPTQENLSTALSWGIAEMVSKTIMKIVFLLVAYFTIMVGRG